MDQATLIEWLLGGLRNYGEVALVLVVFSAALGLPLPSTLFVIASGAALAQGILQPTSAISLALIGVVLGDLTSYLLGHTFVQPFRQRYAQHQAWQQAENHFTHQAGRAILLSRFLLTPLALPINLIAGASRYPTHRFLRYVVVGEALWLIGYGGIGYLFSSQWAIIAEQISTVSSLLAIAALIGGLISLFRSVRSNNRMGFVFSKRS